MAFSPMQPRSGQPWSSLTISRMLGRSAARRESRNAKAAAKKNTRAAKQRGCEVPSTEYLVLSTGAAGHGVWRYLFVIGREQRYRLSPVHAIMRAAPARI